MSERAVTIDNLELLTQSKLFALWAMRVPHTLGEVLQPGYFDAITTCGMRRGDLIQLVYGGGVLEHALLCVDESVPRDKVLRVSLLQPYVRMKLTAGTVEASESGESDKAAIN